MQKPALTVLDGEFTIHRYAPTTPVPSAVFESSFYWLGKTTGELSVVCDSAIALSAERNEPGWSCLEVSGPVDFGVTGLIADLSAVLASAGIGVFVLSTFDTDYVLVKSETLRQAERALRDAGHEVRPAGPVAGRP